MDNKILIGLILTCYLLGQCQTKQTDIKDFVGKEYRDLDEFDFFKNYRHNGGVLIESPDHQDFVLSNYSDEKQILLLFTKTRKIADGKVKYEILDIQEFPAAKNRFISPVSCTLDGKEGSTIAAVCESPPDKEVESYSVLKAWKLNWETRLLEPIETKGVECFNPTYGEDTN